MADKYPLPFNVDVKQEPSEREKRLVQAYIGGAGFNLAEAGRMIGMSQSQAQRHLEKPHVREYMTQVSRGWYKDHKQAHNRVMRELESIAFSNIADYMRTDDEGNVYLTPISDLPLDAQRAIRKIKLQRSGRVEMDDNGNGVLNQMLEVEWHDKLNALKTMVSVLGIDQQKRQDEGDADLVFTGVTIHVGERRADVSYEQDSSGEEGADEGTPEESPGPTQEIPAWLRFE